jgi:hypothetical protein
MPLFLLLNTVLEAITWCVCFGAPSLWSQMSLSEKEGSYPKSFSNTGAVNY